MPAAPDAATNAAANTSDTTDSEPEVEIPIDDEIPELSEVIVITAQKREERLVDVPLAVTALSGATIEDNFVNSLESLPRLVPTLTFRKGTTTRNSALFLRGIGTISFSIAAEPSVATVIDGVVYARSGQAFSDMFDVERVEVLRGPQGTLFGKNASAGVINFVTRRPRGELEAEVTMEAFGDDEYRTRAMVSGPVAEGLRARLTGFYGYFDGHVENVYLDEQVNGYSRQGARGLFEWIPPLNAVDLMLTMIADYGRSEDDCCAELLGFGDGPLDPTVQEVLNPAALGGPEARIVDQNLRSRSEDETGGVSLQADLGALGHTFTSISAYREWDNIEIRDGDFLSAGAPYVRTADTPSPFELHDLGVQEFRQFSQELRIMSPAGRRLEYQAGLFYFRVESDRRFTRNDITCVDSSLSPDDTGVAPCLEGLSSFEFPSATATMGSQFDNYSVFGQGLFRITDALRVTGGLRFTRDELSYFHSRVNPTGVGGPGVRVGDFPGPELGMGSQYTGETSENGVTGRAVLQYQVYEDVSVFGSYARGYKGPAFNVFFNFSEQSSLPIAAETSDAFELGVKGTLPRLGLYASVTGFYQQFDNFQANNFVEFEGTIITALTNAGTVSTKGIEAEVSGSPTRDLQLSGSVAYVDAQIDKFNTDPTDPMSDDRAGEPLPLSPDWKLSIGANYRLPRDLLAKWNIGFGSQLSWQSSQYSDLGANSDLRIDSYALWDANLRFASKDDRLSLTFLVRNLLDEHFATLITPGGPGGSFRHQVPRDAHRYGGISLTARL